MSTRSFRRWRSTAPCVSIRRFGANPLKLEDLLNYKAFTPEMVMLLEGAIKARLNIVISGGTGSGKTTLLNTLSSFIPNTDRIVTIEDAAELQLQQDHVVRLETRPPNIEGKGAITATDLVRNALRMRPERIIIGECRGAETLDMLQAMNTGHEGSMTTLHANTPRDALARLETMIMMAGFELPLKAMRQQIASAVDLIVQANRLQGGPRKVTHITEVLGMEQDTIVMQDIYRYEKEGHRRERPGLRTLRGDRRAAHLHGPAGIGRRAVAVQRLPPARHVGGLDPRVRSGPHSTILSDDAMSLLIIPIAAFLASRRWSPAPGVLIRRGRPSPASKTAWRCSPVRPAASRPRTRCKASVLSQPLDSGPKPVLTPTLPG